MFHCVELKDYLLLTLYQYNSRKDIAALRHTLLTLRKVWDVRAIGVSNGYKYAICK